LFHESSAALAVVDRVRAAIRDATWSGTGKATDSLVIFALTEIVKRCRKEEFGASVREVALRAHIRPVTAWRSLRRLANAGWLQMTHPAHGVQPATWRLQVPKGIADREATIRRAEKAGVRVFHSDPSFTRGDWAGVARLVTPFSHDVFRWRRGLGAVKGQIYSLLEMPLKATELAELLGYKSPSNARVHLRKLVEHGLVRRRADHRYERGDGYLDEVADKLGVFGASEKQRARDARDRAIFRRLWEAYEHWKRTGEVVDPETGVVLAFAVRPAETVKLKDLRRAVLTERAASIPEDSGRAEAILDDLQNRIAAAFSPVLIKISSSGLMPSADDKASIDEVIEI
jgi:DNA-binding transcriptional ArsR family regulator